MLPALTPEAADFLARYLAAGEDLHAVLNPADPHAHLTALNFLNHPAITPWLAAHRARCPDCPRVDPTRATTVLL